MKAYVLHSVNDLRYEEVGMPQCPKDWAIVRVKAAGICSSDIPRVFTRGTYHFPTIPGHEISGEVYAVGDEINSTLIGRKVGVFPLIPCRRCPQCMAGHYEMCSNYDYVGSRRDGGFAEYVAVPVWNLIGLPEAMPFETAAMLEPLSVALHAIKRGGLRKGDSVAVIGSGMIGLSAGQWAYKFGAGKVTVIGRNENKRHLVEACGLDYEIHAERESTQEYDLVLEAVGTILSVRTAIMSAKPGATVILTGNPSGDMMLDQNLYWRILRKQIVLTGTWNSSYDGIGPSDWTEALNAVTAGEINVKPLITHVFRQDRLNAGLVLMREHDEPYCKVMTIWNG